MKSLMIALMMWIGANSTLPFTTEVPDIERVSAEQMHYMALPGTSYDPASTQQILALYLDTGEVLYLQDGWAPDNPRDVSILVHELVHHMQAVAGRKYRCRGEQEKEAYDVQERFLASIGRKIEDVIEIDRLFLFFVTTCQDGRTW